MAYELERGRTLHPLSRAAGEGNFFMKPNGVFFLDKAGAHVQETEEFATRKRRSRVTLATQSGPLLVRRGVRHPKFIRGSKNALIRSGVGVRSAKSVVIVVSQDPVTFHDLASLFRDELGCPDALYLDGTISRLWAPALGRDDDASGFMGILSVSARKPRR